MLAPTHDLKLDLPALLTGDHDDLPAGLAFAPDYPLYLEHDLPVGTFLDSDLILDPLKPVSSPRWSPSPTDDCPSSPLFSLPIPPLDSLPDQLVYLPPDPHEPLADSELYSFLDNDCHADPGILPSSSYSGLPPLSPAFSASTLQESETPRRKRGRGMIKLGAGWTVIQGGRIKRHLRMEPDEEGEC
ncbi:hypothetical protein GUITHDRAFT_145184 [Guillardia theta CCMP2712]|uniref:Uncharacterized protein n=1 Tax=Guillardia theta (strain CCMP2712) TaxID=905079 RepID=L1ILU7_GUITC|nr:hypothetical protein GUITHDRAFT_145184 [Guillardia theta CCMP2712]EKX37231.1 hypothetical protein GUITHDRAFT_145184 [Guillardia theta CCMP2712]|eukprot:XP_005824211.1 hypothetical protein GUITHDRAFT_145184 [Guillardia theta CCMP2712]